MSPETAIAETADKAEILNKELAPILKRAGEIKVADPITYQLAGEEVKTMTQMEKRVVEYWAEDKKRAHELHKSITKKESDMLLPIKNRKASLILDMKRYDDEQETKRKEAERIANEVARKAAEDAALAEAEDSAKQGNTEQAEKIIEQHTPPPPVVLQKSTPAGYGTFTKKVWFAHVTDLMALVRAAAIGQVPLEAVVGLEKVQGFEKVYTSPFLNNQAKQFTDGLRIPGVVAKWK